METRQSRFCRRRDRGDWRKREGTETNLLVGHLPREHHVELSLGIRILVLGLESSQDSVLEVIVEVGSGGDQAAGDGFLPEETRGDERRKGASQKRARKKAWARRRRKDASNSLLILSEVDLEADHVSVLDLANGEGALHLHGLDHPRFDLLLDAIAKEKGTKAISFELSREQTRRRKRRANEPRKA